MNVGTEQTSTHEYAFVGCPSRFGSVVKKGPITGIKWNIPCRGTWIDAEDAEILTEIVEEVWCFRSESFIKINSVLYLNPTQDDMLRRP